LGRDAPLHLNKVDSPSPKDGSNLPNSYGGEVENLKVSREIDGQRHRWTNRRKEEQTYDGHHES
jgi:hypothetical protein